jgi:superfamily II DNA or RNA helicase
MIDTELYEAKKLYPFQQKTVTSILAELEENGENFNLLFQLPTGGGKTVIFSEIAKAYIDKWKKKVLILTHRIELSVQTSKQLIAIGVDNKVINIGAQGQAGLGRELLQTGGHVVGHVADVQGARHDLHLLAGC